MASSTYKDIIDDKVADWHNKLKKLEEQAAKASSDRKAELRAKLDRLKSRIEHAVNQLHGLDGQEKVENTLETKDKILQIFNAIDEDFPRYEEQTPYML